MAELGAELRRHVGEPEAVARLPENASLRQPLRSAAIDQPGIVAAVDQQLLAGGRAERLEIADPGIGRGIRRAAQLDRLPAARRLGQRRAGLVEILDHDLGHRSRAPA